MNPLRGQIPEKLRLPVEILLTVLLIDPLSALSAGFVLSFSAMLGILLYARPLMELLDSFWKPLNVQEEPARFRVFGVKAQQNIKALLAVSLTAQLGVLLPTMRYFHQIPLYGILINLLRRPPGICRRELHPYFAPCGVMPVTIPLKEPLRM